MSSEDASEESVSRNGRTEEQSIEIQFHGSSGDRSESLLQSSDLEPGSKPAATTTGDITSDTGDSLVRVLSNLRTSWVTTVMAFGGATIAQLYRMVELMNPGMIPNVMILVGTNDISKASDEQ